MRPPPPDWPRLAPGLVYRDPARAIDWLCRAFGFRVRLRVDGEGGRVEHCELEYGGAVVMTGSGKPDATWRKSPLELGGACTQSLMLYVDEVDAHHAHALAAGAEVFSPLKTTDYGEGYWTDRGYGAQDLEGHRWWFLQRLRDPAR